MEKSQIAFIAIINSQDQPVFVKNYCLLPESDLQFQLYSYTALELIELHNKKKLAQKVNVTSYCGYLTSIFLSDYEMDIIGYCSATKTRIIVILVQKPNLVDYNESVLKQFLKGVHDIYLRDVLNPFHDIKLGVSENFKSRINKLVDSYDKSL